MTSDPKSTYVLYHASCNDGFGAALAAWIKYGDSAVYLPCSYGEPMPNIPDNKRVFILDFSFPREQLLTLNGRSRCLMVLDHHQTAQDDLADLDFAVFDLNKSGARLAWEYFFPEENVPELIAYIEDRDLWRFNLQDSYEVSATLSSYTKHFETWDELLDIPIEQLASDGQSILRYKRQIIDMMAANARLIMIDEFEVPVVNASCEWSEVADRLLTLYPDAPFAAAYFDKAGGKRQWSLRSRRDFSVNRVAQRYGGGGHPQAAGFVEDIDEIHLET